MMGSWSLNCRFVCKFGLSFVSLLSLWWKMSKAGQVCPLSVSVCASVCEYVYECVYERVCVCVCRAVKQSSRQSSDSFSLTCCQVSSLAVNVEARQHVQWMLPSPTYSILTTLPLQVMNPSLQIMNPSLQVMNPSLQVITHHSRWWTRHSRWWTRHSRWWTRHSM